MSIHSKKKMEKDDSLAVKERTVLYSSLMNAPAGIAILKGHTHVFEFANTFYEKLIGRTVTIGNTVREVLPEIEQQGLWQILDNVFETGESFTANELPVDLIREETGHLEKRYLNVVVQPIKEEDGNFERLLSHVIDVSAQVEARKRVEANEKRFSDILSQSLMAIAIFKGPEMVVSFANKQMLDVLGKGDDVLNKPLLQVVPELKDQVFPQLLADVYRTGVPYEAFEVKALLVRHGLPEEGYFNFIYQPYQDIDDTITGITVLATDVTEQVLVKNKFDETQQRFSMLADSIPNLAWMAYADGRIFWYNKKWFEYTGTKLADMKGWGWQSVHDPEELPKVLKKWKASIETGQPFEMVFSLKGADGRFRKFLTRVLPVLDRNNKIYRWFGTNTDISKQIEADQKIKESETKFRTLAETIPHLVWTATPDGKKNFFNHYYLDYTANTFEELNGDGWQKNMLPFDLEKELKLWRHSLLTGEDFKIEKRIRRHDGTYRWHLSHNMAQKDALGNVVGWIGTNTDITEQKSFTEALEEKVKERTYQLHIQNETFKHAEESSKQGSYSFNLTTEKLVYSDNLFRLIGYEPNAFVPALEEFNKHVHPDDKDYVIQAAQKVLESKVADEWHYRMITKSGELINIKGTGRVIESGDEILLVGTLQNVTKEFELNKELQEKEEYRHQIINNAPDAVIVINEDNIITLWNPKTEEIFGWKAEEVLGLNLSDIIIPGKYREAHRQGMKRFMKTGEVRVLNKTLDVTALNKERKEFPISLTISHATQQGSNLFIAFIRDITLEKRTKELAISNQSLIKANIELEASQKLSEKLLTQSDEFISIASHEMKTPLTTAKGYIELLLLSLNEENESVLYASKASQAVERLHDLVTELLDATKIQHGKLNYNISTFNFNKMVEEAIENIQLSSNNHLILKTGIVSQQVTGDRERLQQVLINLLSNAVKYSPKADKVLVKMEELNDKILVSVQDFGIGMSGRHLNKIFDRYYRVQEHAIHFQGLGIGLYISHNIIERHNGGMWVESEPDKGSIFYFTLPQ